MSKTALLIVDVQNALMKDQPYEGERIIANIKELLGQCRSKGVEVIYVRHDGGPGDEMELNSSGWQIYGEIAPEQGERIFEKNVNSAFRGTGLQNYLDQQGITTAILAGMQTEYCIDVTCKVAFEFGYHIIIAEGTITTFDNKSLTAEQINQHYHYEIWNNRYAKVLPIEKVISEHIL